MKFAIVLGAALIAAAIFGTQRYQLVYSTGSQYTVVWRIDRLTGDIWVCGSPSTSTGGPFCRPVPYDPRP